MRPPTDEYSPSCLAHDVEIDFARLARFAIRAYQRRQNTRHQARRPQVDVLVETRAGTLINEPHSETWSGTVAGQPTAP